MQFSGKHSSYLCKLQPWQRPASSQRSTVSSARSQREIFSVPSLLVVIVGRLQSASPQGQTSWWSWQQWLLPEESIIMPSVFPILPTRVITVWFTRQWNPLQVQVIWSNNTINLQINPHSQSIHSLSVSERLQHVTDWETPSQMWVHSDTVRSLLCLNLERSFFSAPCALWIRRSEIRGGRWWEIFGAKSSYF